MRSAFVQPGSSIHYYVVEFDPKDLKWEAFRGEVLGPTDPADAPKGSLRAAIYADWRQLGLKSTPTIGENGVHASASPFEGGGRFPLSLSPRGPRSEFNSVHGRVHSLNFEEAQPRGNKYVFFHRLVNGP